MEKFDNIHIDLSKLDGYNKRFVFVQSPRSTGKSTIMCKKIYKAFKEENRPSLIIRRQIVDISEQYINDMEGVINKFLPDDEKIKFYYKSTSIKEGIIDIYINENDMKLHKNVFLRFTALSIKMVRLKGGFLKNIKYMFYDEYIIDVYNGEKYLPNEVIKFKELYNTYYRESPDLKAYFMGNIYSIFNPFHDWIKLDYNKIFDGCILSGDNWIYNKYEPTQELIDLLMKNPLYQDDPDYTNYALYGIAVNDLNKIIVANQPQNFKLAYLFKTNNKYIGVYRTGLYNQESYLYWAASIKWNPDYQRQAMCFDFGQLGINTFIPDRDLLMRLRPLKYAMQHRNIAFDNIATSYALEYIYSFF